MRKILKFFMLALLLICVSYAPAYAYSNQDTGINIDGSFHDWDDKPFIEDPEHDIKSPWLDFLNVKYIADNKYLYLYVERLSAEKSEPWHFNVVILNGTKGEKHKVFPYGDDKPLYAPLYDIILSYDDRSSSDGAVVNVSFDGEDIESTYSSKDNGKAVEFRIPLERVGLDGVDKEIKFMLASDIDDKEGIVDWVPDGRPITVTTGSTFWQMSTAILLITTFAAAYGVFEKKQRVIRNCPLPK